MGDFGVISDVSETIVGALNAELANLTPRARAELNDLSGAVPADLVLTVTLYEILEDAASRNRPRVQQTTGAATVTRKPPMALLLRYLLTPWGGDQPTEQRMAGRAMQVLYDDAILDGLALKGTLAGGRDTLKITLAPLSLEDRTRVCRAEVGMRRQNAFCLCRRRVIAMERHERAGADDANYRRQRIELLSPLDFA